MEFFRRFLLVICTLAAVSTVLAPAPVLYVVKKPDFAAELRRDPFPWEHKGQTVEQYRAEKIRGRILRISTARFQSVLDTARKRPGGFLEAGEPSIEFMRDRIPVQIPTGKNDEQYVNKLTLYP